MDAGQAIRGGSLGSKEVPSLQRQILKSLKWVPGHPFEHPGALALMSLKSRGSPTPRSKAQNPRCSLGRWRIPNVFPQTTRRASPSRTRPNRSLVADSAGVSAPPDGARLQRRSEALQSPAERLLYPPRHLRPNPILTDNTAPGASKLKTKVLKSLKRGATRRTELKSSQKATAVSVTISRAVNPIKRLLLRAPRTPTNAESLEGGPP